MNNNALREPLAAVTLERLKWCLDAGRYTIDPRDKNRSFLAEHGYSLDDQLDILRSLTPQDCYKAEPDRANAKHLYWFHKKRYEDMILYVKYKIFILHEDGCDFAYIKSIHEDEY